MPTARPIISARVGVVEETVATDATTRIPANVMPTPRPAVSSGRPAASNETKVTASTTKATATPISSVALIAVPVLVHGAAEGNGEPRTGRWCSGLFHLCHSSRRQVGERDV